MKSNSFFIVFALCLLLVRPAEAQLHHITLTECQQWVQQQYPLLKQKELYRTIAAANDAVLKKNALPQVKATAQGTYQSEVTEFELPGGISSAFPEIKPDQYRIGIEINHSIYDFGELDAQRKLELAKSEVQVQQVEVDMQKVVERINLLYGNVLLLKENRKILALRKKDLSNRRNKVASAVENGVSLRTNLLVLESDILTTEQRTDEINADLGGLVKSLSLLTGQIIDTATQFELPVVVNANSMASNRPELTLFALRKSALDQQNKLLEVANMPRIYWFGQGFFGRPGFNFLKQNFRPYGIVGIGAEWSISGYYSSEKKREALRVNNLLVDNQASLFDMNLQTELARAEAEINKYQALIGRDQAILKTKTSIRDASASQLENGVITSSDYLTELDAENAALLNLSIHQIQLAMAEVNYQTLLGNK